MSTRNRRLEVISQALARDAVARAAASTVFSARAATVGPRGMAGSSRRQGLYIKNKDQKGGYALNAVSLERIPRRRAVKVGAQYFDSRTLRNLLKRDARATNPLTRQPFPSAVYKKYAPLPGSGPAPTLPPRMTRLQRRAWHAAGQLTQQFLNAARQLPAGRLQTANIGTFVKQYGNLYGTLSKQYDVQASPYEITLSPLTDVDDFFMVNLYHRQPFDGSLNLLFISDEGEFHYAPYCTVASACRLLSAA